MPRGIPKLRNDNALQEAIREKLQEANAAFVDAYATTPPKQMATYYAKIMAMRDMAENGFGIPAASANGNSSVAATRPLKGFLPDRVKLSHHKRKVEAAAPAPEPKQRPGRRPIPFTVKSREFEGVTQRAAIVKTLARSESEMTTEQLAIAIAERGYPFELSEGSNITEPISTIMYKMKVAGEVKHRIVSQPLSHGVFKGRNMRMALWSLAGKARLHVSKGDDA